MIDPSDAVFVGSGFLLEDEPEGRTLVVTDTWTAEAEAALMRADVDGLNLNYARGYRERSLEFLSAWPIRRLAILSRTTKDLSPVLRLRNTLEVLDFEAASGASLDLGAFPTLTAVGAGWEQIRGTIGLATGLTELRTDNFSERDLLALTDNVALRTVVLKVAPSLESLLGVQALKSLQRLWIAAAPRLHDLSSLQGFGSSLETLQLESCRSVNSLTDVRDLINLRWLSASNCGDIESLQPVLALQHLERFHAWESTRIVDGDLSPLAGLPRLKDIRMVDRRGYHPRVKDLKDRIDSSG